MIRIFLPVITQILLCIVCWTTDDLAIRPLIFTAQLLFLWYQFIVKQGME